MIKQITLTDPNEINLILRWRHYRQWIKSLPPNLFKPIQCEHNSQCDALEPIPQNKKR